MPLELSTAPVSPARADDGAATGERRAPRRLRLAPSVADLVFLVVFAFAAFGFGGLLFNGDADLGRHVRMGDEILRRGLFFRDFLSYTNAGRPFVPYEWLSEVIFALTHRAFGLLGVTLLAALLLGAAFHLIVRFMLRHGVAPAHALAVALLAATVSLWHWAARPHLFTFCAIPLTLEILECRRARPILTLLLFALWANLHGGFAFGLVLVGIYLAAAALERDRDAIRRLGLTLAAALVGACINPVGPRLFAYVLGALGQRSVIDATVETLSPDFHQLAPRPFLLAIVATLLFLGRSRKPIPLPRLLVACATLALGLTARRNMEFFALAALPLLALSLPAASSRLARSLAAGERSARPGAWSLAVAVVAVALLVAAPRSLAGLVGDPAFLPHRYPVAAVARARAAGLNGHLFNDINYGGYILYAWPEQRVFIDGQVDFYGSAFFDTYRRVTRLEPGWEDVLRRYDVSLVLVPASWRLVDALKAGGQWRVWYVDSTAALLVRAPARVVRQ